MENVVCFSLGILSQLFQLLRGIRCNSLSALVLPAGTGKSYLASHYSHADPKRFRLIDLDEVTQFGLTEDQARRLDALKASQNGSYDLEYRRLAKNYVDQLKHDFPRINFVLISSSYDTVKYCGVKPEAIHVIVPTQSLMDALVDRAETAEKKALMVKSRLELLMQSKSKQIASFASFEQLTSLISDYGIINKL